MNQPFRPLTCFLSLALFAGLSGDVLARSHHKQVQHAKKADAALGGRHQRKAALKKRRHEEHVATERQKPAPPVGAASDSAASSQLSGDLAVVKNVFDLTRKGKTGEATAAAKTIDDVAARKLVEWFILRHSESDAGFGRYAAYIANDPGWPSMGLMRRRAEARLWQEKADAATVLSFI